MKNNADKVIEVLDMTKINIEEVNDKLNKGYTILMAFEKGKNVTKSIQDGWSEYLNAKVELKEEKENCGICGCGKPANILVYVWR
ncbi:hypothetical protein [Mesoplasma coleopterae]|uniref:hypothetical protein n=1 Tax=Mesoplasma coleopterae TaxID=324078 RepID=UPI000D029830|nr:hypothetical protein [Mesoplasma coleopterae]AVN63271.1 hypothetical protein CG000_03160 [Mesoplasma coleopterae]